MDKTRPKRTPEKIIKGDFMVNNVTDKLLFYPVANQTFWDWVVIVV